MNHNLKRRVEKLENAKGGLKVVYPPHDPKIEPEKYAEFVEKQKKLGKFVFPVHARGYEE